MFKLLKVIGIMSLIIFFIFTTIGISYNIGLILGFQIRIPNIKWLYGINILSGFMSNLLILHNLLKPKVTSI